MKKYILISISALLFCSCVQSKIFLYEVEGSEEFPNSSLTINEIKSEGSDFLFDFNIDNYELGSQTSKNFKYNLANSDKGQHIHFILNNGPYSAHYESSFTKKIEGDSNILLAFLSRSYHESVKNPNAYVIQEIGGGENIDLNQEFLFYSRPKGTYEGLDTEKLLLDFYLVNTELSPDGNKVRLTITQNGLIVHYTTLDRWVPYYIEGLEKGEVKIKLELINAEGNLVDTKFNPSERTITLK